MSTYGVGMASPTNLSSKGVEAGLLKKLWESKTAVESVHGDPILGNKDLREPLEVGSKNAPKVPSKVILDITPSSKLDKGVRDITLKMVKSLSGAGQFGNTGRVMGNEENLAMKYAKAHSNDWMHGVTTDTYGIDFREMDQGDVYKLVQPLLSQWRGELEGYMIRDAWLNTRSFNLASAPLSLTRPLNSNWHFPGLANSSQPVYQRGTHQMENEVGRAAAAVTASDCHLTISAIRKLISRAENEKYIKPIDINGRKMYVLLTHYEEYENILDESRTGTAGNIFVTGAAVQEYSQLFKGDVGVLFDKVLVIKDPRAATMSISGTSADYAFSFGYKKMGRVDTRTTSRTSNVNFNINMLLGAESLLRFEAEAGHFEEQMDEYKKYKGVAYIGALGYEIPNFDVDSPTDSTLQQESSMVIPTQR